MRILPAVALFTIALSATPALAQGDAARGEAMYQTACAECHRNAERIASRVEGATEAERATAFEAFLPEHYAPDPAVRADIIAYLLTL